MQVVEYMIRTYAYLVKYGARSIESLPESYRLPVAGHLAAEAENENN